MEKRRKGFQMCACVHVCACVRARVCVRVHAREKRM